MKFPYVFLLALIPLVRAGGPDRFTPTNRVSGIGISRDDISDDLLEIRTERMIESQTFSIMREAQALPGAKRVTGNAKLQALFRSASAAVAPEICMMPRGPVMLCALGSPQLSR